MGIKMDTVTQDQHKAPFEFNFNQKLPVESKDPDDIERFWYENVYQGDHARQLTIRSALIGMIIGAIMSLSNLYVGLKTGWGMGVTITATILAFSFFKVVQYIAKAKVFDRLLPKRLLAGLREEFTVLENNAMGSAASAAGYIATAGLISSLPALMMTTGQKLTPLQLGTWMASLSMLGVVVAIPMKRNMINVEQLRFPTGIATATTLKSMHAAGENSVAQAKALGIAGLLGASVAWLRDGAVSWMKGFNIPPTLDLPGKLMGTPLTNLTIQGESSLLLLGAGAIMGMRITLSMMLGSILYFVFLAPWLISKGIVPPTGGYRDLVKWSMWPGAAVMLTSGLLIFFLQWKTLVRAFSGLADAFKPHEHRNGDPLAKLEIPGSWFLGAFVVLGIVCVFLQHQYFQIPVWMGVISVLLSFLLAIVAARATGETDITPISAMGQLTQLIFGAISPGNLSVNLMTAGATAGISSHSADLLTDLKSGYLLGAKPRQQFFAQFLGIVSGAVICVPVFNLLVPSVEALGTQQFPAPSAQVYAGVAKLLSQGFSALPSTAITAMMVMGVVGILLGSVEYYFPKVARWLPSPVGLGIALVVPFSNALMMFLGALIAWSVFRVNARAADRYVVPVASGVIAGESLMGIVTAILAVTGAFQ